MTVEMLKYTCFMCEHEWVTEFDPCYGQVEEDCPECNAQDITPEIIEEEEA